MSPLHCLLIFVGGGAVVVSWVVLVVVVLVHSCSGGKEIYGLHKFHSIV